MEEEVIFSIEIPKAPQAITTIENLTRANKALREERKKLDLDTEQGRRRVEEINKAINDNTNVIKENSSALEKQRLNVGNYTESIKDAASQIQVGGVSVGDLTGKLTSLLNPVTAGVAAFGALVAVLGRGRRAQELFAQASAATSGVLDKLTKDTTAFVDAASKGEKGSAKWFEVLIKGNPIYLTVASSIKALDVVTGGYISSLREAGEEAAKFEARLQKIRILNLTNTQTSKELLKEEEKLRQIRDDDTRSFPERIAANEKILELEERRRRLLVSNVVKELEIVQSQIDNIGRQNASLDLLQREADLLNERADIIEDSTGKESEALTNRNSLQKEYNALLQETKQKKLDELAAQEKATQAEEDALIAQLEKEVQQVVEQDTLIKNYLRESEDQFRKEQEEKDQEALDKSTKAVQKAAEDQIRIEQLKNQALAGFVDTFFQKQSAARFALSAIFKKDAISETFINTKAAAVAAYKSLAPIPIVGPVLGIAAAAAATAYGLNTVAQITGINFIPGFARGGVLRSTQGTPIQRSNGDDRLITAKVGETILTREQTARIGTRRLAAAGVPGFATGGQVNESAPLSFASISRQTDSVAFQREIFNAISQIRPVVTVEDINSGQERVEIVQSRAQVI